MSTPIVWTQKGLERLPPHDPSSPSRAKELSHPGAKGLKLEISKNNTKTFWYKSTFRGAKVKIRIGELTAGYTLAEALEMAAHYRAQIDRGIDPRGEIVRQKAVPRFGDFVPQHFLTWAYQNKAAGSAKADESKFKHHLNKRFGHMLMSDITRRDVEQYHGSIKSSHCAATANRHLACISAIYSKAISWGIVSVNPAQGVKKFKENNQKTDYLTPDEIQRLVAAMADEPNEVAVSAIKFLLFSGLRRQEALSGKWENVNFLSRTMYLPTTKSGRDRHVPLNDSAMAVLTELKAKATSEWIFPGKDPRKPYVNLKKPLDRLLAAAGLQHRRLYPHLLRHTYATLLVSNGVSLYLVSKLLGHASVGVTQRYAHLSTETLRESSQVVSRIVRDSSHAVTDAT